MALGPAQHRVAQQLYALAIGRGLSPNRAREFVAASYAESGLDPSATNHSSGAAGLFQLLSSGYRNRAQQLGGLYDPRANAQAILPDYVNYWKQHPNAAAGDAGRDVERSGEGSSFYVSPLSLLSNIGGAAPAAGPRPLSLPSRGAAASAPDPIARSITRTIAGGGQVDFVQLAKQAMAQKTAGATARPDAARSRPTTGGAGGNLTLTPGGGKPGHIEPALISLAKHYGLQITSGYRSPAEQAQIYAHRSTPGSVAAPGRSWHQFGRAIDVAPSHLQPLIQYVHAHPGQFKEFFYDPLGWYVKNGQIVKGAIGGHGDHAHVAI